MGGMPNWGVGTDESMDAPYGAAPGIEAAMEREAVALTKLGRAAPGARAESPCEKVCCVSKCEDRNDVSEQEDDDTSSEDGWAYVCEREKYPLVDIEDLVPANNNGPTEDRKN